VLLFNQQAVTACGPICQDLYGAYVRYPGGGAPPVAVPNGPASAKAIARWLLQQMAQRGNGVYQEFNDFTGIGNLSLGALDYSSLFSQNVLKTLLVQPLSSEPGPTNRVVDTDGDACPTRKSSRSAATPSSATRPSRTSTPSSTPSPARFRPTRASATTSA
jgi:hypothetical protein